MSSRDAPWMRPPPRRKRSRCCLILVLVSILFGIIIYNKSSGIRLSDFGSYDDGSLPFRDFSIKLHPKEYITRLPKSLKHHWNITKGTRAPDGVDKIVYLINGEFPGPTIEARTGDQLVIVVSNQLDDAEGVAFHWHGLHMKDANHMDGAVGVTQKEIPAGQEFTYLFEIAKTQSGTFWYHSHSALQRADGLYGGLVVHKRFEEGRSEAEKYGYIEEQLLLIGDWYHHSAPDVQTSYLTIGKFGNEPVPDSVLVNGLGYFDCPLNAESPSVTCKNLRRPNMQLPPKATRLRVVNVGAMPGINVTLDDTSVQVIKIDGGNTIIASDWVNTVGTLYPGEKVDIITSGSRATSLIITRESENLQTKDQAIEPPQIFSIDNGRGLQRLPKKALSKFGRPHHKRSANSSVFDLATALGPKLQKPMPKFAEQTIVVYAQTFMREHTEQGSVGYINGTNWIPQSDPLINVPREQWDEHQLFPHVMANDGWVDLVVNNIDDKGYAFHLHGHDFYVLTRHAFPRPAGDTTYYNPFEPLSPDELSLYPDSNTENPRLKDTVHIPGRGYAILRIRADNIGLWFFQCDMWLQGTGMSMGLDIR